ncbi:MAG: alpha/beta fold hydrolase [Microthrixaceae bacterium]
MRLAIRVCVALVLAGTCACARPTSGRARSDVATSAVRSGSSQGSTAGGRLIDGASGFAVSDGLRIHYEVRGEGPPLVLVHGWGASVTFNWAITGWLDALSPVRQVIAIDIRGHGDSDKPHTEAAYGYGTMSHDVIAVMDHLGVDRADYVGYSLGADVGAYLLGHRADRFRSMVLMGIGDEDAASLALAPRIATALRADRPDRVADPEARAYRELIDLDPRNDREALALAALEMWPQGYPVRLGGPGLASVHIPVLVLNGAEDPYAATVGPFLAAVPGVQSVEIPGADHLGVLGNPAFKDAVVRFLSSR